MGLVVGLFVQLNMFKTVTQNKTTILMTGGSLMKVESIAECFGAFFGLLRVCVYTGFTVVLVSFSSFANIMMRKGELVALL